MITTNDMKKIVGKVTEDEKTIIKAINNHKNSLEELLLILDEGDDIYTTVLNELNETRQKYQEWWNENYHKYQWERGEGKWTIVFETNEIVVEIN